jgi:hypothetical protein
MKGIRDFFRRQLQTVFKAASVKYLKEMVQAVLKYAFMPEQGDLFIRSGRKAAETALRKTLWQGIIINMGFLPTARPPRGPP